MRMGSPRRLLLMLVTTLAVRLTRCWVVAQGDSETMHCGDKYTAAVCKHYGTAPVSDRMCYVGATPALSGDAPFGVCSAKECCGEQADSGGLCRPCPYAFDECVRFSAQPSTVPQYECRASPKFFYMVILPVMAVVAAVTELCSRYGRPTWTNDTYDHIIEAVFVALLGVYGVLRLALSPFFLLLCLIVAPILTFGRRWFQHLVRSYGCCREDGAGRDDGLNLLTNMAGSRARRIAGALLMPYMILYVLMLLWPDVPTYILVATIVLPLLIFIVLAVSHHIQTSRMRERRERRERLAARLAAEAASESAPADAPAVPVSIEFDDRGGASDIAVPQPDAGGSAAECDKGDAAWAQNHADYLRRHRLWLESQGKAE